MNTYIVFSIHAGKVSGNFALFVKIWRIFFIPYYKYHLLLEIIALLITLANGPVSLQQNLNGVES